MVSEAASVADEEEASVAATPTVAGESATSVVVKVILPETALLLVALSLATVVATKEVAASVVEVVANLATIAVAKVTWQGTATKADR